MTLKDNNALYIVTFMVGVDRNELVNQIVDILEGAELASDDDLGLSLDKVAENQHISLEELIEQVLTAEQLQRLNTYSRLSIKSIFSEIYLWGELARNPCRMCGSELELDEREGVITCSHFNCDFKDSLDDTRRPLMNDKWYGME